jgi:hypothetical protein
MKHENIIFMFLVGITILIFLLGTWLETRLETIEKKLDKQKEI